MQTRPALQGTDMSDVAKTDTPKIPKAAAPRKEYVRAVHGELRHLFTNVVFTSTPQKVEIDNFIEVQEQAGKLAFGED